MAIRSPCGGDDPDDRTSRGGYQLWSWGAPIEWRSSKQTAQALSTTEAEYMAACEAVKAVVWARRLYQMDFGYDDLSIFNPDAPATEAESKGARPVTVFDRGGRVLHSVKERLDILVSLSVQESVAG